MPLAILINGGTASAAEIVSGSFAGHGSCRVGGTTFVPGAGWQAPRDLPYNGKVKITMSKYYIPSAAVASSKSIICTGKSDGSVAAIPDSLTSVFYTSKKRPVRDAGGVRPSLR